MHKLIIVDDEDVIRDGLVSLVDWEELGFEVIGNFEDGKYAIEYLQSHKVDVVLSDIRMVYASGIDLAQYIYTNNLNTKIVLISGYEDFEYAKKAINLNVSYLISKPTDIDELSVLFSKLNDELNKEDENRALYKQEKERYKQSILAIQEQILNDLMMGNIKDKQEIDKKISKFWFGEKFSNNRCHLIEFRLQNIGKDANSKWEHNKHSFYKALRSVFYEDEDFICHSVDSGEGRIFMISIDNEKMEPETSNALIDQKLNTLHELFMKVFGFQIEVASNTVYENIYSLSKSNDLVIRESTHSVAPVSIVELSAIYENQKKILDSIVDGNMEGAYQLIDAVFLSLSDKDITALQNFAGDLISLLSYDIKNTNMEFYNQKAKLFDYKRVFEMKDREEIAEWAKDAVFHVIKFNAEQKDHYQEKIIETAKQYIKDNSDKDISLNDVAKYVFLNPVYFSRFFKERTGENFVSYLRKVRMEKVKKLLMNPEYMINQICSMVGYKDNKYFTKVFKKYTGMSPSQYRRTYGIKSGKNV